MRADAEYHHGVRHDHRAAVAAFEAKAQVGCPEHVVAVPEPGAHDVQQLCACVQWSVDSTAEPSLYG